MRQLTGSDHLWFALETENAPLHFVGAAVYDPSTRAAGPIDLEDLKATVAAELPKLPLRQRLLQTPWSVDLPYWVDAEDFDLGDHVRELVLEAPGNRQAFLAAITDLLEAPFDMSKPLWEMNLIRDLDSVEGFPQGSFAVVVRVHHGQFDGTTALKLMNSLHTDHAGTADATEMAWKPERTPSPTELLARAPWNLLERGFRATGAIGRLATALARRSRRADGAEDTATDSPPTERPPVPRTRFSKRLASPHRVFEFLHLPLEEVKGIRSTVEGSTVNDVAASITGGALRKYLQSLDELPEAPLVAMMPVSAHDPENTGELGNRISLMASRVHTEIDDPVERLRLVRRASARSKRTTREVGAGRISDVLDVIPTNALGLIMEPLADSGLLESLPMPFSGIAVTNVPGPPEPLYFDGARMVTLLGATFLYDFVGLIVAITSYCDELLIAFTSSPDMVPDPGTLADCFLEAWEELRDAAASHSG